MNDSTNKTKGKNQLIGYTLSQNYVVIGTWNGLVSTDIGNPFRESTNHLSAEPGFSCHYSTSEDT